jgi:isoleucyl-tRNA synthetase
MDAGAAAEKLLQGGSLEVHVKGKAIKVLPEEVEVRFEALEGFEAAKDGPYVAALNTILTPELEQEGLMREFLRRVQDLRKQADLNVADRIRIKFRASEGLAQAVEAHRDYVMAETLADALEMVDRPKGEASAEHAFSGEELLVCLSRT